MASRSVSSGMMMYLTSAPRTVWLPMLMFMALSTETIFPSKESLPFVSTVALLIFRRTFTRDIGPKQKINLSLMRRVGASRTSQSISRNISLASTKVPPDDSPRAGGAPPGLPGSNVGWLLYKLSAYLPHLKPKSPKKRKGCRVVSDRKGLRRAKRLSEEHPPVQNLRVTSRSFRLDKIDKGLDALELAGVQRLKGRVCRKIKIKRIALRNMGITVRELADLLCAGTRRLSMKDVQMDPDPDSFDAGMFSGIEDLEIEGGAAKCLQRWVEHIWAQRRHRIKIQYEDKLLYRNALRGTLAIRNIAPAAIGTSLAHARRVSMEGLEITAGLAKEMEACRLEELRLLRCAVDPVRLCLLVERHSGTLKAVDLRDTFITPDVLAFVKRHSIPLKYGPRKHLQQHVE